MIAVVWVLNECLLSIWPAEEDRGRQTLSDRCSRHPAEMAGPARLRASQGKGIK